MEKELIEQLVIKNDKKIIFLIMDGLGGLPQNPEGKTELETAETPNLDRLVAEGTCGLLDPISYGITPGSGPAHFALFGYDPVVFNVGRGLLGAAGLEFNMAEGDLYIRANFATMDKQGLITDRRAGRIPTEKNQELCALLQKNIPIISDTKIFFTAEKEHRAMVALRGVNLQEEITETDPQKTDLPSIEPKPLEKNAQKTAAIIAELLVQVNKTLAGEDKANTMLLRGYARYQRFPSFAERYGLNALAIASYPMYRGIASLLGMKVAAVTNTIEEEITSLKENFAAYNFFFIHIKYTDSRGEDGKFDEKVKVIEKVDSLLPDICALNPDVLVVTGDHSTPAVMSGHSWHPVPVLLAAKTCRPDWVTNFGERTCLSGGLGRMPMKYLISIALAHAGKLQKFGA